MTERGARVARLGLAAALAIALSLLLDGFAFRHLFYPQIHDKDWGRLLRAMGSLAVWLPLALAVWLETRARERPPTAPGGIGLLAPGRPWLLLGAPVISGLAAEILKILFRRERPGLHDGEWVFRSFADRPFSTSAIGLPSSHAMVAFAGATIVARLFPRAAPVAYVMATGCALTRVLARAHFLSDVVVGAAAGWLVAALLWSWSERRT